MAFIINEKNGMVWYGSLVCRHIITSSSVEYETHVSKVPNSFIFNYIIVCKTSQNI